MGQQVRSARGVMIDFELLAIKQQLATTPTPKAVEARKYAIAIKDGVRTDIVPEDVQFESEPLEEDEPEAGPIKQTKRK